MPAFLQYMPSSKITPVIVENQLNISNHSNIIETQVRHRKYTPLCTYLDNN